ncbi:SDR family NAD(P)-dependent oxidoreductase [Bacillus subtilis]|nr:SDR family NAD(P)-dependent oxidoreductase [Bacillus subtilis]
MTGNTVLITGGSAGIGLELAKRLLELGNEVIICGRSEARLAEAKQQLPNIHTKQCDVADRSQREALYEWALKEYPNLNVLVNNAGIQKEIDFKKGQRIFLWTVMKLNLISKRLSIYPPFSHLI